MMPEPKIPTYSELINHVIPALVDLGGSGNNAEIRDSVAGLLGLDDEQISYCREGQNRPLLATTVANSLTLLRFGHYVENSSRGVWSLTSKPRPSIRDIRTECSKAFQQYTAEKKRQRLQPRGRSTNNVTEDEVNEDLIEEAAGSGEDISWSEELLRKLRIFSGTEFENFCQMFLRESGFDNVEKVGGKNDGGIDLVGILTVGLISSRVYIQCKCYTDNSVGPEVVRNLRGAVPQNDGRALLITTSTFTKSARNEAQKPGFPPVDLVDGERLCELMKEQRTGLEVNLVEKVSVVEGFFERFKDDAVSTR